MAVKKAAFPILIAAVFLCMLTGCGQKDQATKVQEDALTKLLPFQIIL